jgi:hypothetical protein
LFGHSTEKELEMMHKIVNFGELTLSTKLYINTFFVVITTIINTDTTITTEAAIIVITLLAHQYQCEMT